jgi:hypothetical protein
MIRLTNKASTVDKDSDTINGRLKRPAPNKMFAQWWGSVLVQSAIFVQRLVTWDSEAFLSPTTAQTQTLCASQAHDFKEQLG